MEANTHRCFALYIHNTHTRILASAGQSYHTYRTHETHITCITKTSTLIFPTYTHAVLTGPRLFPLQQPLCQSHCSFSAFILFGAWGLSLMVVFRSIWWCDVS